MTWLQVVDSIPIQRRIDTTPVVLDDHRSDVEAVANLRIGFLAIVEVTEAEGCTP
jgi:hypothetical protein